MVFLCIRILYGVARQFEVVFDRVVSLFWREFDSCRSRMLQKTQKQDHASIYTVCTSGGDRDDTRFRASFTIEATVVLGVLFMTIASLIRHAYIEHDKVVGTMVLEEVLVRARRDHNDVYQESYFEKIGEQLGSSQLWFDNYDLEVSRKREKIEGKVSAGEWTQEMEMSLFNPSTFLRLKESFPELMGDGEENNGREYPIQTGDE